MYGRLLGTILYHLGNIFSIIFNLVFVYLVANVKKKFTPAAYHLAIFS